MTSLYYRLSRYFSKTQAVDGIAPLLLRLYLAPIFIIAGYGKLTAFDSTVYYFGEYLNIPFPALMVTLAGVTEFVGGILLLMGLAVRFVSIPLMITMAVAAVTAHWEFGWHALPESTLTMPWEWRTDLINEASERKDMIRHLLQKHGNYEWLTGAGTITILKNGVEFAATYFIMLSVLFFSGGGRYVGLDYWISQYYQGKS